MTFPTIADADTTNGTVTTNSNSWTLTYPANIGSGDLLVVFVASDGGPTITSTGFSQLAASGNGAASVVCLAKSAGGTESGTFTLSLTASEQGGWRIFRIPVASWYGGIPLPAGDGTAGAGTGGGGASQNPDPPANNPFGWDVEDTLWFAACGVDTSRTISVYPLADRNTADVSGGANGATLGLCTTESAVASLDPGTFTISASDDWGAVTIGVRPAPSVAYTPTIVAIAPSQAAHRASSW